MTICGWYIGINFIFDDKWQIVVFCFNRRSYFTRDEWMSNCWRNFMKEWMLFGCAYSSVKMRIQWSHIDVDDDDDDDVLVVMDVKLLLKSDRILHIWISMCLAVCVCTIFVHRYHPHCASIESYIEFVRNVDCETFESRFGCLLTNQYFNA